MAEMATNNQDKSTFEELWRELDHNQRRYAVVMIDSKSKREGAEAVGLKPNTVYGWPDTVDTVIEMLQTQHKDAVLAILQAEGAHAAMVKVAGLDSYDEIRRQDAATEILDRTLGKPTQRNELTGKDGGPIETSDVGLSDEERANRILAILDAARTRRDRPPAGGDGEAV